MGIENTNITIPAETSDLGTKVKPKRKILRWIVLGLVCLLTWVLWPIYGFVSNQFEVARFPLGWQSLPADMPIDENIYNPSFSRAGQKATKLLAQRREAISAPSISAAIVIEGELVWASAIGWGDIKNKIPVTTKTTYRIGSTSKAVGITGLARLVSKGQIDLDRPIGTYATDLPNPAWENFTAKQLASHTAGLAAYEENNDWIGFYQSLALTTRYDDPQDALSVFDGADILFTPGDDFHYSGFDNILLSAVMQQASDQPYDDVMIGEVFSPLGLKVTGPDHLRSKDQPFAQSYQTKGEKFKLWREVDLSHKIAAGGYASTPSEIARLGAAWLDDDFMSPSVRETFWTPVKLSNGQVNEQNYALGFRRSNWTIPEVGEITFLNHGGVSKGAQCWLMIIPEHNMSVAISINRRTDDFFDFADIYVDLLAEFIPAIAAKEEGP